MSDAVSDQLQSSSAGWLDRVSSPCSVFYGIAPSMIRHRQIRRQFRRQIPTSKTPWATHRAYTLLELTVVLALLGVVAIAASSLTNSSRIVGTVHGAEEARHLVAALRDARTQAVMRTTQVRLRAIHQGADVIGFATESDSSGTLQPDYYFPERLQIRWNASEIVFSPTGMSDVSLAVEIESEDSEWTVTVFSASGQTTMQRVR